MGHMHKGYFKSLLPLHICLLWCLADLMWCIMAMRLTKVLLMPLTFGLFLSTYTGSNESLAECHSWIHILDQRVLTQDEVSFLF